MTFDEAKSQLNASTLRPGDADAEARALAASDPALKEWLEKRTAEDKKLAACFMDEKVPAGLSDRLVAALEAQGVGPAKRTMFRSVVPWLALATAEAIAVIGTVGLWRPAVGKNWQAEALAYISQIDAGKMSLDQFSGNLEELKTGLAAAQSPSPGSLPKSITDLPSLGCKVIQVAGRPASVICFEITPGHEAHLIVIANEGLHQVPPQHKPQFDQHGDWHVASWSDGSQSFLLATQVDEKNLKRLFGLAAIFTDWMRGLV